MFNSCSLYSDLATSSLKPINCEDHAIEPLKCALTSTYVQCTYTLTHYTTLLQPSNTYNTDNMTVMFRSRLVIHLKTEMKCKN